MEVFLVIYIYLSNTGYGFTKKKKKSPGEGMIIIISNVSRFRERFKMEWSYVLCYSSTTRKGEEES